MAVNLSPALLVNTENGPEQSELTGAWHGSRVRFGAEVSFVADAGSGSFPDGVAVERALGAGAVGGQSAIVADLTGWKKQKNRQASRLETIQAGKTIPEPTSHRRTINDA